MQLMGRVAWPQLLMGGRLFQKMLVGKGVGLGGEMSGKGENLRKLTNMLGIWGMTTLFCMLKYPWT